MAAAAEVEAEECGVRFGFLPRVVIEGLGCSPVARTSEREESGDPSQKNVEREGRESGQPDCTKGTALESQ